MVVSTATGGTAQAIGIWYQSLGAAAALSPQWDFKRGAARNIYGEATKLYQHEPERLELLLEYFDMDVAISDYDGKWFVQFKVSGKRESSPFGKKEAREVLSNATQAMLRHSASTIEPIAGLVVASNRPVGKFELIAKIAKRFRTMSTPDPFSAFATSTAPNELFSDLKKKSSSKATPAKAVKTMRDLARSITVSKASEWHVTVEEATNACLQAMWTLRFAQAHPIKLEESVNRWLSTWGVLPDEYDTYTTRILGALQKASFDERELSEMGIMRDVYGLPTAVPLTPKHIWPSVVHDFINHRLTDPPTQQPLSEKGIEKWILDRSELLQGLPYSFAELAPVTLDDADSQDARPSSQPRIFALVGDGGVGKSILLRQLFARIAGSIWDWRSSTVINGKFLGCPVIMEPEPRVLENLDAAVMNWAGRRQSFDASIKRIAHANGVNDLEPALWLGLDGLDEIPEDALRSLAKGLANFARSQRNVRIVLASRTDHFRRIKSDLDADGLLRKLQINEFTKDQSTQALSKATDQQLRLERTNVETTKPNPLGTRTGLPAIASERGPFDDSIRQPLFIGVLRRLYLAGELPRIQDAYGGGLDSFKYVASEYLYDSCERMERRLYRPHATASRIFQSIKQLSLDTPNTALATRTVWTNICDVNFRGHVQWFELFSMCLSSGLIKEVRMGPGAFEWRHPLVGDYLTTMTERADWQ